ncbi:MAG: ATP-binding protein, partial [Dehalococcoidia bacterium]|nr:ATP-binding protein [Dehalococcoidia bacterium]
MQAPPPALLRFLETKNGRYYERFLELRERASAWLAYIPATFPAYTRHTVDHSDEIILQISKILFEPDSLQPTLPLSAAEAYVIAVAALLHDAGMVVSDAERMSILDSPEWKEWVGRGEPVRRYAAIQEVREEAGAKNADVAHLVADVALRQLIAEFVRGQHHSRSSELVLASEALGRFAAFEDPALLRIIADVCAAHGLDRSALEDPERFPDRLDIQEDVVNVRFIALLVRLGDLLDMRFDRACPMLLQAAAPIPTESLPHWTQYQRITGRLTAPDRIEIRAECATADEDRILRDWCQWIIDEIAGCRSLMHGAKRHGGWAPPGASLDGSAPSIVIRPSKEATYEPAIWRFELDDYAILDRLISDAYVEPLAFVRELLQNALDATRVRVFQDLRARGGEPPATPTMIPEEVRQRFPIVIALRTELQKNAFSGAEEERQILSIEDSGCGMSRDVFQRYFLQVGRSFYQSEEFRRANTFTPTSRFGIGFLSVFGVSDRVTVDTSSSTSQEPALRATLTGPRNYLLLEKSARSVSGTKIELLLSNSIEYSALLSYLLHLCVRVEFPVQIVSEIGLITTVTAEQPSAFVEEFQNDESPPRTFAVRRFPADGPGVEGDLYVFAVVDSEGHESWAEGRFGLSQ